MTKKSKFYIGLCSLITFLTIIIIYLADHMYYMTCPTCNGEGEAWVKCDHCDGEEYVMCDYCDGVQIVTCKACGGEGGERCFHCQGTGGKECISCQGKGGKRCDMCWGEGIDSHGEVCFFCQGRGIQRAWCAKAVAGKGVQCVEAGDEASVLPVVVEVLWNASIVMDKDPSLARNVMQRAKSLANVPLAKVVEKWESNIITIKTIDEVLPFQRISPIALHHKYRKIFLFSLHLIIYVAKNGLPTVPCP